MLGYKPKIFKLQSDVSLDDLVPKANFYRQLEAKLDLCFVRRLVQACHASNGTPFY